MKYSKFIIYGSMCFISLAGIAKGNSANAEEQSIFALHGGGGGVPSSGAGGGNHNGGSTNSGNPSGGHHNGGGGNSGNPSGGGHHNGGGTPPSGGGHHNGGGNHEAPPTAGNGNNNGGGGGYPPGNGNGHHEGDGDHHGGGHGHHGGDGDHHGGHHHCDEDGDDCHGGYPPPIVIINPQPVPIYLPPASVYPNPVYGCQVVNQNGEETQACSSYNEEKIQCYADTSIQERMWGDYCVSNIADCYSNGVARVEPCIAIE